jgi:hypothetical protein
MKRFVFHLAVAVSLVLSMAMAVLWVRSYFVEDVVRCEEPGEGSPWVIHVVWASRGRVSFGNDVVGVHSWDVNAGEPTTKRYWKYERMAPEPMRPYEESFLGKMGLFYEQGDAHGERWVAPIWIFMVVTSVPLVVWLRALVRRRWASSAGICVICGYDLRATPERCPECGKAVGSK